MNWYIGQEIVCIKTHSKRRVIEGELYVVKGLRYCELCAATDIDVGLIHHYTPSDHRTLRCDCGKSTINDGKMWLHESLFRPLDSIADISELTEILKAPVEKLFEVKQSK